MRKLSKTQMIVFFSILLSVSPVCAHSGRTDANGGHYDSATGQYHYHHGYSAHYHTDGICPYDFDDKTGSSNGSSSSSTGTTSESSSSSIKSTSSHPLLNVLGALFILFAPSILIGSLIEKISDKKKEKERILAELERKRHFEEEKMYYSNLYQNKSISELANIPSNIEFDEIDLPISVDNSGLKWGKEFTVFVSKNGRCYHRKPRCCGVQNTMHIFNAVKSRKIGCSKCVRATEAEKTSRVPEWYLKYLEIKEIKSYYKIDN